MFIEVGECRKIEILENLDMDFDGDVIEFEIFGVIIISLFRLLSLESDFFVFFMIDVYVVFKIVVVFLVLVTFVVFIMFVVLVIFVIFIMFMVLVIFEVLVIFNIIDDFRSLC